MQISLFTLEKWLRRALLPHLVWLNRTVYRWSCCTYTDSSLPNVPFAICTIYKLSDVWDGRIRKICNYLFRKYRSRSQKPQVCEQEKPTHFLGKKHHRRSVLVWKYYKFKFNLHKIIQNGFPGCARRALFRELPWRTERSPEENKRYCYFSLLRFVLFIVGL